jgi:hypothetical protein
VLLVLLPLGRLEHHLALSRRHRTFRVEMARDADSVEDLIALLEQKGLRVHVHTLELQGDRVSVVLDVAGHKQDLAAARGVLLARTDVLGLQLD